MDEPERFLTPEQDAVYRRAAEVVGVDAGLPGIQVYRNDLDEGPEPVPVVPRWWITTDMATLSRLRFLPDYEPMYGDMVVVGMRTAWDGGEMELVCDPDTGQYFRKETSVTGTVYGRVFAPAPPPVGLWSGELPDRGSLAPGSNVVEGTPTDPLADP